MPVIVMKNPAVGKRMLLAFFLLPLWLHTAHAQGWTVMETPAVVPLYGLWGTAVNNVVAVGQNGIILRYDGTAWAQQVASPTAKALYAVWGSSAGDVFAVGETGTIVRYDGSAWSTMAGNTFQTLHGVSGASAADVYAAGDQGTIMQYNGSLWTRLPAYTIKRLNGIAAGIGGGDIFAVGQDGVIVQRRDGVWSSATVSIHPLYAVWAASASDAYAVGESGTILQYDGSSWTEMASHTTKQLYSLWGASATDVYAVGEGGTIIHFDGAGWTIVQSPTTENLYSVWGVAADAVFAAGASGTVLRYGGGATVTTTSTAAPTTTTTISSDIVCPFSRAARGRGQPLRQLRNERLNTAVGAALVSMYYRNVNEIDAILHHDDMLRLRFGRLVLRHLPLARRLLVQGSAAIAPEDLLELYDFLLDLQDEAGPGLRMDIDFLLLGIEAGWLPEWLGLRID